MNLLSICDNADILNVIRVANTFIDIFKIAVPIALILSLSLEFMSASASQDADIMKKATSSAVRKAIAAILIFLVPSFVSVIFNFAGGKEDYANCMSSATIENINALYAEKASRLMEIAVNEVSNATYEQARSAVRRIVDKELRAEYEAKLADIKQVLTAKDLIARVRKSKTNADYEKALAAVNEIKDEELKNELEAELEEISKTILANMAEYSSEGYVQNDAGLPYYRQCDSRWGSYVIDRTASTTSTVCTSACGYTSFAMIAAGYNNDLSITPVTIVQEVRGPNPTSWGYGAISDVALYDSAMMNKYNMKAEVLFSRYAGISVTEKDRKITTALSQGKAIVMLIPGHYIVFAPARNGAVTLLDSAWYGRNGTYSSLSELKAKLRVTGKNTDEFVYAVAYSRAG